MRDIRVAISKQPLDLTGCCLGNFLLDYSPYHDVRRIRKYWLPSKGHVHIVLNKSISNALYSGIEQDVNTKIIDGLKVLRCYFVPDKDGVAELKVANTFCSDLLLHQGMLLFKE